MRLHEAAELAHAFKARFRNIRCPANDYQPGVWMATVETYESGTGYWIVYCECGSWVKTFSAEDFLTTSWAVEGTSAK